jgi:hypothetical protein
VAETSPIYSIDPGLEKDIKLDFDHQGFIDALHYLELDEQVINSSTVHFGKTPNLPIYNDQLVLGSYTPIRNRLDIYPLNIRTAVRKNNALDAIPSTWWPAADSWMSTLHNLVIANGVESFYERPNMAEDDVERTRYCRLRNHNEKVPTSLFAASIEAALLFDGLVKVQYMRKPKTNLLMEWIGNVEFLSRMDRLAS